MQAATTVGVPLFLLYGHRKAQEANNRGGGVSSSSGAYGDGRGALAFGYFVMGEGGKRRGQCREAQEPRLLTPDSGGGRPGLPASWRGSLQQLVYKLGTILTKRAHRQRWAVHAGERDTQADGWAQYVSARAESARRVGPS